MLSSKYFLVATEVAERLDLWLHRHFPEYSRSRLQQLIREERVRLGGKSCVPKTPVAVGDEIEMEFPSPQVTALEPEAVPLDILFEDESLIVLNKPAGIVVHPGAGHRTRTLVHALLHHCQGQLSGIGGVERPGIVHRLDKDTSGCLVVAKTDLAHRRLVESFQSSHSHGMEKIYLALVWGKPRMLSGHINQPIGRHPVHRKKMSILIKGRPAQTDWKIHQNLNEKATLLECRIYTGRTHQVRVHLASIGHSVVGDSTYGRPKDAALHQLAGRQMLHAWRISFHHPIYETRISCEAPIPDDLQRLIAVCNTEER